MPFTKQDGITFLIGAGVAVAFVLGEALIKLEGEVAVDWQVWARDLGIGALVALGRYLATRLAERQV